MKGLVKLVVSRAAPRPLTHVEHFASLIKPQRLGRPISASIRPHAQQGPAWILVQSGLGVQRLDGCPGFLPMARFPVTSKAHRVRCHDIHARFSQLPISSSGPKCDSRSTVTPSKIAKEKRDPCSTRSRRASALRSTLPRQPCSARNFIASVSIGISPVRFLPIEKRSNKPNL